MIRMTTRTALTVFAAMLFSTAWLPALAANGDAAMEFKLASPAFQSDGMIPGKFTCDGADVSPALAWSDPPSGTQSFALIMDDPDAPGRTWVHWVLYDLPAEARELPEGVPKQSKLASGAHQGNNDFPKIGYGGPCPPHGPAHRYFFKLYALDAKTGLKPGATKAELENAMKGHILAQTELVGRYRR
ncbi:MAG TPA: YbhB/YbcL family Raf kinase inhibitor-like protein [Terriglobia bacterium]|nr:YbhB/YbcL family Raf kinase inhibitor-like protein [Terriglobia bacterium]